MAVSPVSSSATGTGIISALGIGSGLDVNSIISQLMAVESQPLTQLNTKEAAFQAEVSAFGSVKSALSSFQSSFSGLNSLSTFQALAATSSDTTVLTATAGSTASAGTLNVQIAQLAQAQALVAAGQASSTTSIGDGTSTTITFDFGTISGGTLTNGVYSGASFTQGTAPSGSVTIDSSNNSLQGIRDAINNANAGVTATIVNDGSGTPYRLVLQSSYTGAASSIRVSVSGDAALESLLGYDPAGTQNLTQTNAAQDASLSINGLGITSATNTVTDAVQGVTLNLIKAGSASVAISRDPTSIQTAISGFVKGYNDLQSTLTGLTFYDPTTQQAGTLIGDFTVQQIQSQLRDLLTNPLPGSGSGGLQYLAQLGISFEKDGTLSLDATKLQSALAANPGGVAGLFTAAATATDSLVSYVGSTDATQAGNYAVNVSHLATQGQLAGSAPAGLTITAGVNDQVLFTVDGISSSATLAAGTYTASSLAAQLQAVINGSSALQAAGSSVSVTQSGGVLTLTSALYGSASNVGIAGTAVNTLLGTAPVGTAGTDVAGTIGGIAASGSGQFLTGAAGSATDGLKIQIAGGGTGSRGNVSFSRGYADQLDTLITQLLSSDGSIAARLDGINSSIQDIDQQRTELNDRLTQIQAQYQAQFTALDTLISSMQSTSSFLTQQLALLTKSS